MDETSVADGPAMLSVRRGIPSDDIQYTSAMGEFAELTIEPKDNEDRLVIAPDRAGSLEGQ